MMSTGSVPIMATTGSGKLAGSGMAESGSGFLDALAQRITEVTGKPVSPETLTAWLEGEGPAGLPGDATLTDLLGDLLTDGGLPGEALSQPAQEGGGDEPVDGTALLEMLVAVTRDGDERSANNDVADGPMTRLRERGGAAMRRLLDSLCSAGDGATAAGRFEPLVQTAAAAMEPAPVTPQGVGVPTLRIAIPTHSPGFGQAVGERVVWMVRNEVQYARIQINPPGFGPLDVSLTLQDDRATVAITAYHAITRDAMSADAARLRDMLAVQGFASVNVNVSSDGGARAFGEWGSPASSHGAGDAFADVGEAVEAAAPLKAGSGLVDQYV